MKSEYKILVLLMVPFLMGWGIFGHEHINRAAILALPDSMKVFFYNHIDFVTIESTVPDLRKYTLKDQSENPKHFINLESFGNIDTIPRSWNEAKDKYDEKFLNQNGTLPWHIQEIMSKLTKAFKTKRKAEILFLAADLGHYMADAQMPLHTSIHHDGKSADQKGIHSLWEARLPEVFGKRYKYNVGKPYYIEDCEKETWRIILNSHKLVDTLLNMETALRGSFEVDKIFEKDSKGMMRKNKFNQPVFSKEYVSTFHNRLNGMVEKQMQKAILYTANYWYTAWVNAGRPNLSGLDNSDLTNSNVKMMKKEEELYKNGTLFGIESEQEF